jgi:DNA invertase Pin-like site-specific DNA recombinase
MRRAISIGERGGRLGEDNGRAKLTDREVELVRALHFQHGMTYAALAEKFEVSKSLIGKICRFQRRAEIAAVWRTLTGR